MLLWGYVLTQLLILPIAAAWAFAERTRWSSVVLLRRRADRRIPGVPTPADLGDRVTDVAPRSTASGPGRLLVAVYGILALAATARGIYQVGFKLDEAPVAYVLSLVSGIVYVVATIALAKDWRTVAWWAVSIELVGVLTVGVLSLTVVDDFPDADGVVRVRSGLRLRPGDPAVPRPAVAVAHGPSRRPPPRVERVYRLLFDVVFRRMDPERAHELSFGLIRGVARVPLLRGLVARVFAPPVERARCRSSAVGSRPGSGSPPASTRTPTASRA